ncbi:putative T7SS-secreted protein [Lapillicoccus sp.]|uniref:putative T7SS-secreted protein n=1 Tax=Lapillicoccus sp. TaxID=1909287 RepID=UPI003983A955
MLVPGDLHGFALAADTLRGQAGLLDGTVDTLSRIEVTNRRGQASTGFLDVIQVEPGRWRTTADAFTAAATALDSYSASLAPARELTRT